MFIHIFSETIKADNHTCKQVIISSENLNHEGRQSYMYTSYHFLWKLKPCRPTVIHVHELSFPLKAKYKLANSDILYVSFLNISSRCQILITLINVVNKNIDIPLRTCISCYLIAVPINKEMFYLPKRLWSEIT